MPLCTFSRCHFGLRLLALVLGWLVLLAPALGQSAAPAQHPDFVLGPNVSGIQEYRLKKNGLTVLLFPDASSPQITVNVTYRVGSRHEGYGETGMAHLLEHLLFKSTRKFPNLWQELNNRGFLNNGTTWFDRTNYFERFAATPENLRFALEMEADRMVHAKLLPEELATEMTVVRNEFEMGENNPQWALYGRTIAAAFHWHNYGNSTIGNRSDIENVAIENLRSFYRRYYRPDNAVLLVAGRFDPAQTLAWISQYFGEIEPVTTPLPKLWTVEPTQDGEREVTVRRTGDAHYLMAIYRTPAATHPDMAALQVLTQMLTLEPSGQLYQALVKAGLAVSVDGISYLSHDPYVTGFWASLNRQQSVERASEVLLATLEKTAATSLTSADLERAKRQLDKGFEQTLADSARFAIALSEAIAVGDWRMFFLQRQRIASVTLADVQRVAQTYFKPQNRTFGRFIATDKPDRVAIPEAPALASVLAELRTAEAVEAGENFDPTPANIEARVIRYRLPNGLKVVLFPKQTRGGTAHVVLRRGYGDLATRAGQQAVEAMISATLMRGARGLDRQQIQDRLDELRATGSLSLDGVSFQTRREHVPALLQLIGQVYAEPLFPEAEIEIVRKELLTALEEASKLPDAVAGQAIERHFNPFPPEDVRYVPTFAEQTAALRRVTREQMLAHYRRLTGFAAAELVVLGAFDEAAVRASIAASFAASNPIRYQRVTREAFSPKVEDLRIDTPDKENMKFLARTSFALDDQAADYPALLLADFIIGGSAGARLFVRIREKEGLSYDVFSQLAVPAFGNHATWTFGFIANPQNAAKARASLLDELGQLLAGQLTSEEFETQKRALLDQRAVRRARDATLAGQLAFLADTERDFRYVEGLEARLRALTKADFDAVLKKYLDPKRLSFVLAGDFAKVPKP